MIPLQENTRNVVVPSKHQKLLEHLQNAPGVLVVTRVKRETVTAILRQTGACMVFRVTAVLRAVEISSLQVHEQLLDVTEHGVSSLCHIGQHDS